MKCYVFVFGVDGFGADVAPAYEEGVYLDYENAFRHLVELNRPLCENNFFGFYEEGYGEGYYPEEDTELAMAEENEDWELFDTLFEKHCITDVEAVCKELEERDFPPIGLYAIKEAEIKE